MSGGPAFTIDVFEDYSSFARMGSANDSWHITDIS